MSSSFSDLIRYVDDILRATLPDVEQVVIEPDGAWSSPNDADEVKLGEVTPATEDDDDLIEITEPGPSAVKQEPMPASVMLERTPAQSQSQSREASTPSSAVRMSKKRSAAQVIDLTASDDEDDESPVPPAKRLALSFSMREDPHQPVTSSPLHSRTNPPSYQSG
jgi:E3 SUMO-protein ligase PIAS1